MQALVLILQTILYFTLAVIVDKLKRGRTICPRRPTQAHRLGSSTGSIISDFIHPKRNTSYRIEVERGSLTAILGPTESGKSELVNLLATGINKSGFKGRC